MIEQNTFDFLVELGKNNNREWFNDNRQRYENARDNVADFVEDLIVDIKHFDPFITDASAKNTTFRIFKDVRFSKNKDPYKDNFGAAICKGGKKSPYPGYYLHISPQGKSFLGGGIYRPEAAILKSVRNEISFNHEIFCNLINQPKFKEFFNELEGDKLKRPPKGFDPEHPVVELLKHKDWVMMHKMEDKKITQKNFKAHCLQVFQEMKPVNEFLRGPVYDVLAANE